MIIALGERAISRYVQCHPQCWCASYANCSRVSLLEMWSLYLLALSLANLLTCILYFCLDKCAASFALTQFVQ